MSRQISRLWLWPIWWELQRFALLINLSFPSDPTQTKPYTCSCVQLGLHWMNIPGTPSCLSPCVISCHSFEIFPEKKVMHSTPHHVALQRCDRRTIARSRTSQESHRYLGSSSSTAPHSELCFQGSTAKSSNALFFLQTILLKTFCFFNVCFITQFNRISSLYTWILLPQNGWI